MLHLLHIGKTGGNALRTALMPFADELGVIVHKHAVRLADIPQREPVGFAIRHPLSRFVSSFNSRLRMGRPLRNSKWSADETIAFSRFTSPNELAEALSDAARREQAEHAMNTIAHVRQRLVDTVPLAEVATHHVVWIGAQETLSADFEDLKRWLNVPDARLPDDPVLAHRSPDGPAPPLSETAARNICEWYADDVTHYHRLLEFSPNRRRWIETGRTFVIGSTVQRNPLRGP